MCKNYGSSMSLVSNQMTPKHTKKVGTGRANLIFEINKERYKMIGQLINTFEELEKQTVETFNQTFPHSKIRQEDVEFEIKQDDEVEIGEVFNSTRKITINNRNVCYIELKVMDFSESKVGTGNTKAIRVYDADRNYINTFDSMKMAYFTLGYNQQTFNWAINTSKFFIEEVGKCH